MSKRNCAVALKKRRILEKYKQLIKSAIAAFMLFSTLIGCTPPDGERGRIETRANNETLVGKLEDGVSVFRGIPFAQPPLDDLRWRAPRAPIPRAGEQQATEFSAACMQDTYLTDWYGDVMSAFGGDRGKAPIPLAVSEDCLYLNIWAPTIDRDAKLPVMVFFYGGSNLSGWTYEPNYLGHQLSKKNVVVVSVAYRLGIFGAFVHPEMATQNSGDRSGNFHLLDLIAGLQWLKGNVSSFGGDPSNITIFGESAGAANIGYLSVSPLAKGLYHQAIKQSGGFETNSGYANTYSQEQAMGASLASAFDVKTLSELRAIPADLMHNTAMRHFGDKSQKTFYAIVDNYVLPDTPSKLMAAGKVNPAKYLLGSNADENLMYTSEDTDENDISQYMRKWFPSETHQGLSLELTSVRGKREQLALLDDSVDYYCPTQKQAKIMHDVNPDSAYIYYFTRARDNPSGTQIGAYHGAELPYVFGTHDDWLPTSEIDTELSETIMAYWVNFATKGDPNGEGLPTWQSFNHQRRSVMELGDRVSMIDPPAQQICQLLGAGEI